MQQRCVSVRGGSMSFSKPFGHSSSSEAERLLRPRADFGDLHSAAPCTSTPVTTKTGSRMGNSDNSPSDSGFIESCSHSSVSLDYVFNDYTQRDHCLSQSISDSGLSASELERSHEHIAAVPEDVLSSSIPHSKECLLNINEKVRGVLNYVEPHRVIGRRMGLDYVDIVGELSDMAIPCLDRIARLLSPEDRRRCCVVSKSWLAMFRQYAPPVRSNQSNKENSAASKKKLCKNGRESRGQFMTTSQRGCLAPVQPATKPLPVQLTTAAAPTSSQAAAAAVPGAGGATLSLHQHFVEASKSLRCGEKLCKCPRCLHPARLNEAAERGTCTRLGCSYDYCTSCFSPYHGASPCLPQVKRTKHDTIGGPKSKKNLKRL